ncbi:hypothetical protein [Roseospira goensis]|uniref:Uncharacterized protein n=1 Tax=Roseospira goensis TaxID=391922 RepID=A0A7W6S1P1_9PROT|nr:hypothetical protein [Roseospira goensis]MBB4287285.1 hypothetical protein [Roseospira goensis]
MTDRGAQSGLRFAPMGFAPLARPWTLPQSLRRVLSGPALCLAAGLLAVAALGPGPLRAAPAETEAAAESGTRVPVAPLAATVNAAAYGPMPDEAGFLVRRYDDSRENDAIQRALEAALADLGRDGAAPVLLDMTFEVYVIRSGVPALAKGLLEMEEVRGQGDAGAAPPPGIDVTELQGRTEGVEGNVLHRRRDSFAATLRLQVTVEDPRSGAYLWRGWVDTPLNGLSRAEVVSLVAEPLLSTLGQTVAGRSIRIQVPDALGGGSPAE